jgi:hypothetical protein
MYLILFLIPQKKIFHISTLHELNWKYTQEKEREREREREMKKNTQSLCDDEETQCSVCYEKLSRFHFLFEK